MIGHKDLQGAFIGIIVCSAVAGWAVIESAFWLLSFITIGWA